MELEMIRLQPLRLVSGVYSNAETALAAAREQHQQQRSITGKNVRLYQGTPLCVVEMTPSDETNLSPNNHYQRHDDAAIAPANPSAGGATTG
jgi:hypothetical protein